MPRWEKCRRWCQSAWNSIQLLSIEMYKECSPTSQTKSLWSTLKSIRSLTQLKRMMFPPPRSHRCSIQAQLTAGLSWRLPSLVEELLAHCFLRELTQSHSLKQDLSIRHQLSTNKYLLLDRGLGMEKWDEWTTLKTWWTTLWSQPTSKTHPCTRIHYQASNPQVKHSDQVKSRNWSISKPNKYSLEME